MPTYTGISAEAFKHPEDRQAEQALRSVPGFDILARSFMEYVYERPQQIFLLGNNIKAGPRQYSTLYGIFRECLRDLDLTPEPTLYVNQDPFVNAYSLGQEKPYIMINSGLLDLLDEAEIRSVIAHELGHLKCNHSILIQMAIWVMGAASLIGELTFGLSTLITTGLLLAFYDWRRKAELSADRASLLVMDDLNPIMNSMMKLGGGSMKYGHECSLEEFKRQADEYQALNQDGLNQIYKFLLYNGGQGAFLTHPFPVERLYHLQNWANSAEYSQIRQGNYTRAGQEGSVDVDSTSSNQDTDALKQEIEALQAEINRLKTERNQGE